MKPARLRRGAETREVRAEDGAVSIDGRRATFAAHRREGRLERIDVDGVSHRVATARSGDRVFVWCDGRVYVFERMPAASRPGKAGRSQARGEATGELIAPMPGRVRRTYVAEGDRVESGQPLMLLEAMKMEHAIRAPRDGVVRRLSVREGDLVDAGVELAEIEAGADG